MGWWWEAPIKGSCTGIKWSSSVIKSFSYAKEWLSKSPPLLLFGSPPRPFFGRFIYFCIEFLWLTTECRFIGSYFAHSHSIRIRLVNVSNLSIWMRVKDHRQPRPPSPPPLVTRGIRYGSPRNVVLSRVPIQGKYIHLHPHSLLTIHFETELICTRD